MSSTVDGQQQLRSTCSQLQASLAEAQASGGELSTSKSCVDGLGWEIVCSGTRLDSILSTLLCIKFDPRARTQSSGEAIAQLSTYPVGLEIATFPATCKLHFKHQTR